MHISLYLKCLKILFAFCKVRIEEILEDEKPNGTSKKPKKKKNQSNTILGE